MRFEKLLSAILEGVDGVLVPPSGYDRLEYVWSGLSLSERLSAVADGVLSPVEALDTDRLCSLIGRIRSIYVRDRRRFAEAVLLYSRLKAMSISNEELDKWVSRGPEERIYAGELYDLVESDRLFREATAGMTVRRDSIEFLPSAGVDI